MCFVVAGVQPKTKTVDPTPQRCPQCGLHQAVIQQVDHYFSLFFIPLVRVKQGDPFLYCQRCRQPVDTGRRDHQERPSDDDKKEMCRQCSRSIQPDFLYCPHCGQRQ